MPFKGARENKLAILGHVLVFVAFFAAMLGKVHPSTFKGFDGDVIGGFLTFLSFFLILGALGIGLGGWLGSSVSGSKSNADSQLLLITTNDGTLAQTHRSFSLPDRGRHIHAQAPAHSPGHVRPLL